MLLYAVVLLLIVNVSSSHSGCCEGEAVSKSLLDTASDLISKAKSSIPSCSGNEECPKEYLDCADLYESGYHKSGIYNITPVNRLLYKKNLQVYCDMDTDGGGWTVIQRRGNFTAPVEYFFKDWKSYKEGFGNIEEEFWLGNENIFALTNQQPYSIRFDLEDQKGVRAFAKYDSFWIDDEYHQFTLHISGFSGNAGDGMVYHDGMKFSTKDRDNDLHSKKHCGLLWKSGWWFKDCYDGYSNLNGIYNVKTNEGIAWMPFRWEESLPWTEIKIKPRYYEDSNQA